MAEGLGVRGPCSSLNGRKVGVGMVEGAWSRGFQGCLGCDLKSEKVGVGVVRSLLSLPAVDSTNTTVAARGSSSGSPARDSGNPSRPHC